MAKRPSSALGEIGAVSQMPQGEAATPQRIMALQMRNKMDKMEAEFEADMKAEITARQNALANKMEAHQN